MSIYNTRGWYLRINNNTGDLILQEVEDGKDNVVNVAETTGFKFFRMVQSAGPIYGDICVATRQFSGGVDARASI